MVLASFAICAQLAAVSPAIDPSPIAYQLVASRSGDGKSLDVRAWIRVRRAALGTGVDSLHIGLGEPGHQLRLTALPTTAGRPVRFTAVPDSTEIAFAMGTDTTIAIELKYRVAMDTSAYRQLGYDLFPSTEEDDVWYPTVRGVPDAVRRFIDLDVVLTVPRGVAVLMSGAVLDSTVQGTSIRRHAPATHVEGYALAFAPGYVVTAVRGEGILVRAISPASDTAIFRGVAEETARAATWYRGTYGFFPVGEIGILPGVTSARGGFPLSHMYMIHRGDLSPAFVHWITAHELAHYYWGLYVLSSTERLDWLMLGLGIWTDELYLARTAGVPLEQQWRDPHADNSFEDWAVAAIANYDQRLGIASSSADSLDYDYNTYVRHAKGAIAVYLLGRRVGPDRFVDLQRTLLADFRHRALSPAAFAERLASSGVPDAPAFVERWVRGDARLDYAVRGMRPDSSSPHTYWIQVERTGTVPYPVTIAAVSSTGAAVRAVLTGEASLDSTSVTLDGSAEAVRIDPDGVLPMWSGSNLDIQRVFLRAMGAVGPLEPFLSLVRAHLGGDPDPILASLLVERLFETGRYAEIRTTARDLPFVAQCTDRVTCLAALQVARALARLGAAAEARAVLERVAPAMSALGFGGSRRLAATRAEVAAPR